MKLENVSVGDRVVSHSDGFTGGWHGRVTEKRVGIGHPDALFVQWDNGMLSAVALVTRESDC